MKLTKQRKQYLKKLAEDYVVPIGRVEKIAINLGEEEDYERLLEILEIVSWEYDK